MTIRLIMAYILNIFDLIMTSHWINKYGIEIEANPIGRWLYQTNSISSKDWSSWNYDDWIMPHTEKPVLGTNGYHG